MSGERNGVTPDAGAEEGELALSPAPKLGGRLIGAAALGGAVALLLSQAVRNRLLDVLFGAEEEFDYSSVTEPVLPGTAPAAEDPGDTTAPWVTAPVETPDEPPAAQEPPPAGLWTPRAVAPSPAAWGETPPAAAGTPPAAAGTPPAAAETSPAAAGTSPAAAEAPPAAAGTPPIGVDGPAEAEVVPDPAAPPAPPRDWWSPDSADSPSTD